MVGEGVFGEAVQRTEVPEKTIPTLVELYYRLGFITHPSHILDNEKSHIQRPLDLLSERASLLRRLKKSNQEGRSIIFREVHLRDEIAKRSLKQGELSVPFPDGDVKSTYMYIEPPEELVAKRKTKDIPPIVIIPGISNDPECVGALARELAYQGRIVYVLGYPGSSVGTVTEGFVHSVESDTNFQTHVRFFQKPVESLIEQHGNVELWGDSTGCPIVSELLQQKTIVEHTKHAVLIAPASSVDQTVAELNQGIPGELQGIKGLVRNLPKYWYGVETSIGEQKVWKKRIQEALMKQVSRKSEAWKTAKVKKEGRIVVVSGKKDRITKSSEIFNQRNDRDLRMVNSQLRVLEVPEYSHFTPLIDPGGFIHKLKGFLGYRWRE